MAVTFDAATDATALGVSAISLTHTATGTDRAAFVGIWAGDATSVSQVSSGTYAGVSLVEKWDTIYGSPFYDNAGLTLVAPTTGAQTVTVNFAAANGASSLAVVTATGVDQTTPFGTAPATATGTSTAPTVNVTAAIGDLVVDNLSYAGLSAVTQGTGQTERTSNLAIGSDSCHSTATEAGAATVTMSATMVASNVWAINGIAFKALGTGRLVNGCLVNGLLTGYLA